MNQQMKSGDSAEAGDLRGMRHMREAATAGAAVMGRTAAGQEEGREEQERARDGIRCVVRTDRLRRIAK